MSSQYEYWQGRWQRGETGWHQKEVEPELIENFKNLEPTRVLVPLCGKSLDLAWLASRGHEVIGVEFHESACLSFFEEHQLTPSISRDSGFKVFAANNIKIYCGDFFNLTPQILGTIGALYDRAALIALTSDLREKYRTQIVSLLGACKTPRDVFFIQIILEKLPHDLSGPPFSITHEMLRLLYESQFEIQLLKQEEVPTGGTRTSGIQRTFRMIWKD